MAKRSKKKKQQRQQQTSQSQQKSWKQTTLKEMAEYIAAPRYAVFDDASQGCISPASYETTYRAANYDRYNVPVSEIAKQIKNTASHIRNLGSSVLFNQNLNVMSNQPSDKTDDIDEKLVRSAFMSDYFLRRENGYENFINQLHSAYLERHNDIDKQLIAYYGEENCCIKDADIIDVTNHNMPNENSNGRLSSDIIAEAADIIDSTPDVALLWSTSEYLYIRYDPAFDYLVHRVDFNSDVKSVTYEIICYARFRLISDISVIPIFQAKLTVKISDIDEIARNIVNRDSNIDENTKGSLDTHSFENQQLRNYLDICYFQQLQTNTNHKHILTYRIDGVSTLLDLDEYYSQYMELLELDEVDAYCMQAMMTEIRQLCVDCDTKPKARSKKLSDSEVVSAIYNYLRQQMTQPISAVILTNKFIQDKKMSYAKNVDNSAKTKPTKRTAVYADLPETDNQPLKRQVRRLGADISISSFKKPRVMNEDKIIKYITMQWGRKEHLRHYKNGKIVRIKATTVRRKCDDKQSGASKAVKKTPVSYVIDNSRKED